MTFIGEFKDPMVIVLFIAALISLFLAIFSPAEEGASGFELFEPYFEVIIIFAVVILNAVIGTVQEMKAEKALEALKEMSSPTATVKRGGKILDVKASELVPGDIVILEEGRTVPADLRLLKSFSMKADESSLTGESVPSEKDADITFSEEVGVGDRVNEVFMSTPIVYGRGEGVVIATGMNTEIGRIAEMLESGEEEMTPLQKKLAGLSKFLGYLTLGIVIVMSALMTFPSASVSKVPNSITVPSSAVKFVGWNVPPLGVPTYCIIALTAETAGVASDTRPPLGSHAVPKTTAIRSIAMAATTLFFVVIVCSCNQYHIRMRGKQGKPDREIKKML